MCKEFIFYEFLKIETLELNLSFIIWNFTNEVKLNVGWFVSLFIYFFAGK